MFIDINTNGANRIAIHVPADSAATSLAAVISMFESNAVFIKSGWNELTTVTPSIQITLGSAIKSDHGDQELIISDSPDVPALGFERATPEVFVSNKSELAKAAEELRKAKAEVTMLKTQNEFHVERIARLEAELLQAHEAAVSMQGMTAGRG